tara:strand:+ start:2158 stop:2571 length:414 start_codon:yes stop_codon:yes gene_type:complete
MKNWKINFIFLSIVIISFALKGCEKASSPFEASSPSALSVSGYNVGISAVYGDGPLLANGSSQATIRVEVWGSNGQFIDAVPVTLTTTLGTLASSSLTTSNGAAVTTFTAGTTAGVASVTATVENISVSATIVLSRF